jgi:hypothetical protein
MRKPNPAKAVLLLDSLLQFFGDNGEHWIRQRLDDGNGNRCLVGAMEYIRRNGHPGARRITADYISAAIRPRPVKDVSQRLIAFNDRCKNFDELRAVIIEARKLAQADAAQSEPQPAAPKRRRRAKPPADRQRHSVLVHADRAVPAP